MEGSSSKLRPKSHLVSIVKVISIILGILAVVVGCIFINQTKGFRHVIYPQILWEELTSFSQDEGQFEILSTGDLEWTGLKWEINFRANFSQSMYKRYVPPNFVSEADLDKAFETMDRIHYMGLLKGITSFGSNLSSSGFKSKNKNKFFPRSAKFLGKQLNTGVFLSFKAVGLKENVSNIREHLKNYSLTKQLYTDADARIQSSGEHKLGKIVHKTFFLSTYPGHISNSSSTSGRNYRLVIRIPRLHKLITWLSWLNPFYWASADFQEENGCHLYYQPVENHGHRFIPNGIIVSYLFCY